MTNPFQTTTSTGRIIEATDGQMRQEIVREAGIEKLKQIIAWPGSQMQVKKKAAARLMKLEEQAKKPLTNPDVSIL